MKRIKTILSAAIVALLSLFAFGSSFKASAASNYIDVTEYAESKSMYVAQEAGRGDFYYYVNVNESDIAHLVDFDKGYYIVAFAQTATNSPSGFFTPDKQFTAYSSYYHGYTFESSTVLSMMNVFIPEAPANGVAYTVAYENTITSLNIDDEGIPYYVSHDLKACFDYNLGYDGGREPLVAGEDFKVYYVADNEDPVISYDKWYEQKAANAGNPLLLKTDQYFEGISINSHVISDLTYLEIPFEKYLRTADRNGLKDTQIITFAQAQYEDKGEIETELVMYVYYPNYIYSGKNLTYARVEFNLLEQQISNGSNWMDWNILDYSDYTDIFREVSYYKNIIKFSWSTTTSDIILRPMYSGVKTTFNAKINAFAPHEYGVSYNNLEKQEFQFFRGPVENEQEVKGLKRTAVVDEGNEYSYCMGYDTRSVTVNGATVRYRFETPSIPTYLPNILVPFEGYKGQNTDYTDFFYFYFNVTDDETGITWDNSKTITSIDVKYSVALIESNYTKKGQALLFDTSYNESYDIQVNYLTNSGLKIPGFSCDIDRVGSNLFEQEPPEIKYFTDDEIKSRTELLHAQTVVPDKIEYQYPRDTNWNTFKIIFGAKDEELTKVKVTLPTLFKTSDYDLQNFLNNSIDGSGIPIEYQYGLLYGSDANGFPAISNSVNLLVNGIKSYAEQNTYYTVKLHDTANIMYEENGQKYLVKVSKTNVDNSLVEKPGDAIEPGDPGFGFDIEYEKEWYEKLWEAIVKFFKVTLPNFFKKAKPVFIGILITAAIIFVIVIIFKVSNFINTARAARNLSKAAKNLNKKE